MSRNRLVLAVLFVIGIIFGWFVEDSWASIGAGLAFGAACGFAWMQDGKP